MLIPFVEGKRSPNGTDVQQQAEARQIEVFEAASRAIGCLIGISQQIDFLCHQRSKEIVSDTVSIIPGLDDRCLKNYAVLICLAEKVIIIKTILIIAFELIFAFTIIIKQTQFK